MASSDFVKLGKFYFVQVFYTSILGKPLFSTPLTILIDFFSVHGITE